MYPLQWIECFCLLKICLLKSYSQYDSIRSGAFPMQLGHEDRALMNGITTFTRKGQRPS